MRVVVAPDSFKGSAHAVRVTQNLVAGWRRRRPGDDLDAMPLADGGEGTVAVVAASAPAAVRRTTTVTGPAGRSVDAHWVMLPGQHALVELAEACGITLLPAPDPLHSHTAGLGEVLRAALDAGAVSVAVALGGSGSTDGGTGALKALGARFLDAQGGPVPAGGDGLTRLARIDVADLTRAPAGGVTLLVDVDAPLTGPSGAAAQFGPQKGAGPTDVVRLDAALQRLARLLPADPASVPGDGAAGGTGYGLRAAWGARPVPGADAVIALVGGTDRLARADLVVTGEGRFDTTSAGGKLPVVVRRTAAAAGVPTALVCGVLAAPTDGFVDACSLVSLAGCAGAATADVDAWLQRAGELLADRLGRD